MGQDVSISGRRAAAGLVALVAFAWALTPGAEGGAAGLARHYLLTQDIWIAAALIVGLALLSGGGRSPALALAPVRVASVVAVVLLIGGWLGARVVMLRYDLSRDEQMAAFDGAIHASGHVFAKFPEAWRGFWDAVNQTFILPIGDREGWVSAYLPINAALRALFGMIDPTLAGPVYAAVGALALWRIAARLWPDARETRVVVLLLYAGSSQVWITAMTAYAMNAHLALNLVWLWLFLGDRPWRHAAAIAVGFLATGLHQPLFHPLFALPFLDLVARDRRWRLLAVYLLSYAAIGLFWLGWPLWLSAQATTVAVHAGPEGVGYGERLLRAGAGLRIGGVATMAANLVRFATWQHLLLAPLVVAGVAATWARDPLGRALTMGLLLPVGLLIVLLPDQGLGWGYRYLHGLIGSACLLGGYGWRALGDGAPRRAMLAASAVSVGVVLPIHAAMAHRWVAPFAAARAAMLASGADIVLVDDAATPFGQDLVVNRADLSNRPLLMKASLIAPGQMATLCARGTVAFLGTTRLARIAAMLDAPPVVDHTAALRASAGAAGCRVGLVD